MVINCESCVYFNTCKKPKDKVCELFIFQVDKPSGPVVVKTNRIKKG